MKMPLFSKAQPNQTEYLNQFLGLNRSQTVQDNEFMDMENLSSDKFPLLSSRKPRKAIPIMQTNIKAAIAPKLEDDLGLTSFTGIAGKEFYYNGTVVTKDAEVTITDSEKCLVDFNGTILIFPDKLYYSYVDGGNLKKIEDGYENVQLTFYSSTEQTTLEDTITNKITKSDGWDKFKSGDSLTITAGENSTVEVESKYDQADDNKHISCVVSSINKNDLYVNCYNRKGNKIQFKNESVTSGSIKKAMPDITKACVSNNRVFGIGASGEYVYASKLGNFKNWNVFEGLSTDSWFSAVGTDGGFTGIVPYRGNIVLFKPNYIHQIYGDKPQNYSMPKQIGRGCIDGNSIMEVGTALYFLSYDGIYMFTGGEPQKISVALDKSYRKAVSGTDGEKLYMSAGDGNDAELLVYDTAYNIWHKEDDLKAVDFLRYNNYLYAFTNSAMYEIGTGTEPVSWSVTTKQITHDTFYKKGINNLYLRVRLNGSLTIFLSTDEGDFVECGTFSGSGVKRIPVLLRSCNCYQIKIEGSGEFLLEAIEKRLYSGGRKEN